MDQEVLPTALLTAHALSDIPLDLTSTTGFRGLPAHGDLHRGEFAGFPKVGDRVENCRLVAELGRGGTGLVFLALQETLADRPIVLKVTTDAARGEHLKMARLQHTHVMPLYWAAVLPFEGVHVLAMPYLARTTLARLLYYLEGSPQSDRTGGRVAGILEGDQAALKVPIAIHEHPSEVLKGSTWVEFVVRVGKVLAETLAFVHRRNLVHLDLKPSNVLITPDGQPILLDLDIACQPVAEGTETLPWLGGTSEFMSPEQAEAIAALRADRPIPVTLDGHSDQYSLGLMLYAALAGVGVPEGKPDLAALRKQNPQVTAGLAAILARCLEREQSARYPDCHELSDDLSRHEQSLPLRGVRNEPSERWRKWRRRRPLGLPLIVLVVLFCSVATAAGLHYVRTTEDNRRLAEGALFDGRDWQRKGQFEPAVRRFLAGRDLAEQAGNAELLGQLNAHLVQTQRMQKADELAGAVHAMRFTALQDRPPRRLQWVMEAAGRNLWANRALLLDASTGALEPAAEAAIRDQLQELVLLWSTLHVGIVPPDHIAAARAEARAVLDDAERLFGPTLAVNLARERLGEPVGASAPSAAWEFCAVGRGDLAGGDLAAAERAFRAALDRDSLGFVPNFHAGVGALRQQDFERAVRLFSFCAGQDPKAECFLFRGQAYAALGETAAALKDFDHAIAKNPELAAAYHARAELYRGLGRGTDADKDDALARTLGE